MAGMSAAHPARFSQSHRQAGVAGQPRRRKSTAAVVLEVFLRHRLRVARSGRGTRSWSSAMTIAIFEDLAALPPALRWPLTASAAATKPPETWVIVQDLALPGLAADHFEAADHRPRADRIRAADDRGDERHKTARTLRSWRRISSVAASPQFRSAPAPSPPASARPS